MLLPKLYTINELRQTTDNFYQEIKNAYDHKPSSIPFLIYQLSKQAPIQSNKRIQVMVFGGTVFKTAIFLTTEHQPKLINQYETESPLFVNKNIFLTFALDKFDKTADYLAINFAYPLKPILKKHYLDEVLIQGTKEYSFTGLIRKQIGKSIQEYIQIKIKKTVHINVANDTVCLVLSEANKQTWNKTVGGIIGTGTNYAIALTDNQIVDLESGGFNKFPQSETGKIIDIQSLNPGKQLIEKEIAGAYLYKHFNEFLKMNNCFKSHINSSLQLTEIAQNSDHKYSSVAQIILERSASLSACQIAGIIKFLACSTNSTGLIKFNFIMEGNLFWNGWNYQNMLKSYLKKLKVFNNISFSKNKHHSIQGGLRLFVPA